MKKISNEDLIYKYMNQASLSSGEERDFYEKLSIIDWNELDENYGKDFSQKILRRVGETDTEDLENLSNIILLYNNPYGKFTKEFGEIISQLYLKDRIGFIKALNLVKDETINIVYVFRLEKTFPNDYTDGDREDYTDGDREELEKSQELTEAEKETADMFFTMYRNICVSCL